MVVIDATILMLLFRSDVPARLIDSKGNPIEHIKERVEGARQECEGLAQAAYRIQGQGFGRRPFHAGVRHAGRWLVLATVQHLGEAERNAGIGIGSVLDLARIRPAFFQIE